MGNGSQALTEVITARRKLTVMSDSFSDDAV